MPMPPNIQWPDVRQICATTTTNNNIKQEIDDDDERFSPMSTGSFSSGVSIPHMSGPGGNDIERHHQQRMLQSNRSTSSTSTATVQQQQHQRQQQQQQQQQHLQNIRQHHQQQLQRHQLTSSLLMGRSLSSPSTSVTDLGELLQQAIPAGYLLPCPLCDIPLEPRLFRQHLDRHYPRDSPVCPVLQCGRRFAHPNSVRNHMRIKHTLQWAKMKAMRSSGGPFSSIPEFK